LEELLRVTREEQNPAKKTNANDVLKKVKVSPVFSKINLEFNFWKLCRLVSEEIFPKFKLLKEAFEIYLRNKNDSGLLENLANRYRHDLLPLLLDPQIKELKEEFKTYLRNKPDVRLLNKLANRYKNGFLSLLLVDVLLEDVLLELKDELHDGKVGIGIADELIGNKIFVFEKDDFKLISSAIGNNDERELLHCFGNWLFNTDILSMKKKAEPLARKSAAKRMRPYFCEIRIPDETSAHLQSLFQKMSDIENLISISKEDIYGKFFRDHVNHALRVMLLMEKLASCLMRGTNRSEKEKLIRMFSLTGLFHDVGLPIAESEVVMSAIGGKLEDLRDNCPRIKKTIKGMQGLQATTLRDPQIQELVRSLPETSIAEIIHGQRSQDFGDKTGLHSSLLINLTNLEHDIVGALIVADILKLKEDTVAKILNGKTDEIERNEKEKFLIVQAIGLHYLVQKIKNYRLPFKQYPLTVYLVLCDELQEWGRAVGLGSEWMVQTAKLKRFEQVGEKIEIEQEIEYMSPEVLQRAPVPFEPFLQMAGKYRTFSQLDLVGCPINLDIRIYLPPLEKDASNYSQIPTESNDSTSTLKNERTSVKIRFEGIKFSDLYELKHLYFNITTEDGPTGHPLFYLKSEESKITRKVKIEVHKKRNTERKEETTLVFKLS